MHGARWKQQKDRQGKRANRSTTKCKQKCACVTAGVAFVRPHTISRPVIVPSQFCSIVVMRVSLVFISLSSNRCAPCIVVAFVCRSCPIVCAAGLQDSWKGTAANAREIWSNETTKDERASMRKHPKIIRKIEYFVWMGQPCICRRAGCRKKRGTRGIRWGPPMDFNGWD